MAEVGWMALSLNRSVWRLPGRQTNVFFQAVFKVHPFGFFFFQQRKLAGPQMTGALNIVIVGQMR